jgi:outer membrane lipoprotein-sorting protein
MRVGRSAASRSPSAHGWRYGPLPLLFLLAVCGLHRPPPAQGAPASILRNAATAERHVAYVGIKVVRVYSPEGVCVSGDQLVQVWHGPPDKTRIEVLPPAKPAGFITVEIGDHQSYYLPWRKQWITPPVRTYKPPIDVLLKNYSVREVASERVAGRRTRVLQIRPRSAESRRVNAWIDRQTGLTLKRELLDSNGKVISSWQFREINFPRILPATLFSGPDSGPPPELRAEGSRSFVQIQKPGFSPLWPHYLPAGFVETRRSVFRRDSAESVMTWYTDGLSVIMFVQQRRSGGEGSGPQHDAWREREPNRERTEAGHHRGPPLSRGEEVAARMSWKVGDLRLTLVGGVEPRQLQLIADSMAPGSFVAPESRVTRGR